MIALISVRVELTPFKRGREGGLGFWGLFGVQGLGCRGLGVYLGFKVLDSVRVWGL